MSATCQAAGHGQRPQECHRGPGPIRAWWPKSRRSMLPSPPVRSRVSSSSTSTAWTPRLNFANSKRTWRASRHNRGHYRRGRHVYFKMTAAMCAIREQGRTRNRYRGTGGYVLAPPSMHPNRRRYCWSVDCGPEIAAAPAWLLGKIETPNGNGNGPTPPSEWPRWSPKGSPRVRATARLRSSPATCCTTTSTRSSPSSCSAYGTRPLLPPLAAADTRIVGTIAGKKLKKRCDVRRRPRADRAAGWFELSTATAEAIALAYADRHRLEFRCVAASVALA